ncbi:IlvH [Desulforapulum autotrophicum HRM2]|uniref:Acetolactate synthase small subunit n=1 Tax=Desulforapulum autotrophicum (strain ATCC 43914 / DSM 3382 / VKM B-1955 / HRM2) TaxID=177437 RepID=C0QDD2_DESAH|nr:acetolactate synthase small subunit [Desulforapulum autotrophicum]ACN15196.1 IlvH [Desulforapulum autotrophicum HRM2]
MTIKKHILSILVDNEPGVLSRIAGLFSGRGYNIDTLSVAQTMESTASRVTMETSGDEHIVEQIIKQLHKLINVITVVDLTEKRHVKRELALIKVHAKSEHRAEILRIVDIFRCRVVDVAQDYYTIEISGNEEKLMAIMDLLTPMGIIETARTGSIALSREKTTKRT